MQSQTTRQRRIEQQLSQQLNPSWLEVIDESHQHNVPAGAESHFKLVIVSDHFDGLGLLQRQRRVNAILAYEFNQGLHALAMHCYNTEQWQSRGGAPASPACLGGSALEK